MAPSDQVRHPVLSWVLGVLVLGVLLHSLWPLTADERSVSATVLATALFAALMALALRRRVPAPPPSARARLAFSAMLLTIGAVAIGMQLWWAAVGMAAGLLGQAFSLRQERSRWAESSPGS